MTKYTLTLEWTLERGESATDVTVHYRIDQCATEPSGTHNCPPEHYDPGCGWLFDIDPTADGVALTEQEMDAIHSWLEENPPVDDGEW